jgi:hypothetical protein
MSDRGDVGMETGKKERMIEQAEELVIDKREALFSGVRKDENEPETSDQKYLRGSEGWKCRRDDLLDYFRARRGVAGVKSKLASPRFDLEADQDEMRFGVVVDAMERGKDDHEMVKSKFFELYDEEAEKASEAEMRCARNIEDAQAFDDWLKYSLRREKLKDLGEEMFGEEWVKKEFEMRWRNREKV